jgi:quercetin dioxygenase-like cupin family protein
MKTPLAVDSVVLDAAAIAGLPAVRLEGLEGARSTLLWRSGHSLAGVMDVDPGGVLEPHCHGNASHHVWMIQGRAWILAHPVGPGAYVHIPAGVDHGICGVGPEGCRFFYLYIEHPGD